MLVASFCIAMLSRDFDPFNLRMRLPVAVAQLNKAIEANKGTTAYVHCTAGLGRAPGVAVRGPNIPCYEYCVGKFYYKYAEINFFSSFVNEEFCCCALKTVKWACSWLTCIGYVDYHLQKQTIFYR